MRVRQTAPCTGDLEQPQRDPEGPKRGLRKQPAHDGGSRDQMGAQ